MSLAMSPFIFLFILLIIGLAILQNSYHKDKINEYIDSIGGTVINIERRTFRTGPFFMVGKGRTVYRIEYTIDGETKEGWVKFGGWGGPDWRL